MPNTWQNGQRQWKRPSTLRIWQKMPLLKWRKKVFQILLPFSSGINIMGILIKTFQIFPLHAFNIPFPIPSFSPYCLSAFPTHFQEIFGSLSLLTKSGYSVCLFHGPLCLFAFSWILLPRKPFCLMPLQALRNFTSFIQVICYATLLTGAAVCGPEAKRYAWVEPPTISSKPLLHNLCPSGFSMEAKSLLSTLNKSFSLK